MSEQPDFHQLLRQFEAIIHGDTALLEDTPVGRVTRDFHDNNWINCRDGLLAKTSMIRLYPLLAAAPRIFRFEVDLPFKRKLNHEAPIELLPGPIRGTIHYRPDLFINRADAPIAVQLDLDLQMFHPNCSRQHGFVCLGELPATPYPYPLDYLLETHIYPILSYANRRPTHALDREAAAYFALDPDAMTGLEPVPPLY